MKRTYPMIVEQGEHGLFGYFPDLLGLTVGGDTREELEALAREFMRDYLEDYDRRGEPWPEATQAVALTFVEFDDAEAVTQSPQAQAH
jgi:predicted RNase H-like HicB family nuclease